LSIRKRANSLTEIIACDVPRNFTGFKALLAERIWLAEIVIDNLMLLHFQYNSKVNHDDEDAAVGSKEKRKVNVGHSFISVRS